MKACSIHLLFFVPSLLLLSSTSAAQNNSDIIRASVTSGGTPGNAGSSNASLSSSGQFVAFQSDAGNLDGTDSNSATDIFVHDKTGGTTERVSNSSGGTIGNGSSTNPAISDDGNYVVFESVATNLATTADSNAVSDIFLVNRSTDVCTRVSVDTSGNQANGASNDPEISGDGNFVVFSSVASNLVAGDTNGDSDIFRYARGSGTTIRVSRGLSGADPNGESSDPAVSSTGRYIVFASVATNLTAETKQNTHTDIFRYDVNTDTTELVSVDTSGSDAGNNSSFSPVISADGRYVVFASDATDLIASDTNNATDIYRRDMIGGTTTRISVNGSTQANNESVQPAISTDGNVMAFSSLATNLISGGTGTATYHIYESSGGTNTIEDESVYGSYSSQAASAPVLNSNGDVLAFHSTAPNLVSGNNAQISHVYVVDDNCPTDSDGDATSNCFDDCPFDANKIADGICGCGVADTDTDSDATPDCNDECDTDAAKTTAGKCGCGVADVDLNSNGVTDCKEITASSQLNPPCVMKSTKGKLIIVIHDEDFEGVTYQVFLRRLDGTLVRKKSKTSREFIFTNVPPGKYRLTIRAKLGAITSQLSNQLLVKVKG